MGFEPEDIGNQYSFIVVEISVYIDYTCIFSIILIEQQPYNIFLKYIKHQLLDFIKGIPKRMVMKTSIFNSRT